MTIASTILSDKVLITGSQDKWRCGFSNQDELDESFITTLASGDLVRFEGNSYGSRYAAMVRSSTNSNTVSTMLGKSTFAPPTRVGFGLSVSQRVNGEAFVIDAVAVNSDGTVDGGSGREFGAEWTLLGASASGSTVTFKTLVDTDIVMDEFVCIYGFTDTRMDVFGKITDVIDQRTYTVTAEQTVGTIAWLTGSGKVRKFDPTGGASDGFGILVSGQSSTNAYSYTKSSGSPALTSGAMSFGTQWSDKVVTSVKPYTSNKMPRYTTEMVMSMDQIKLHTVGTDSMGDTVASNKRTQNLPSIDKKYVMRVRSIAMPNAKPTLAIGSVVKTGTTTATVTTVLDHGLSTGNYVRAMGIVDTVNFPSLTVETIITVTGAKTFTLTWGPAATVTGYGGCIKPVHSSMAYGLQNTTVRAWTWRNGRLWLGLGNSPSFTVGETVRLHGVAGSSGPSNIDGLYVVLAVAPVLSSSDATTTTSSTTLVVQDSTKYAPGAIVTGSGIPASTSVASISSATQVVLTQAATAAATSVTVSLQGLLLEPIGFAAPANGTTSRVDNQLGGGGVILETDLCLHYMRSLDHTRTPVEVISGHQTADVAMSVPVVVNTVRSGTITANEGSPFSSSTYALTSLASTNPVVIKTSAGVLYNATITNYGAAAVFVKFYNLAVAPTPGTSVPDMVLEVPANKCVTFPFERFGYRLTTGIAMALTGAQALADTTAIAAGQVRVAVSYV